MAKKNIELPFKEWEETINKMSYEELQDYIAAPDTCYPDFLELANDRLKELKTEKMRNTVIKMMAEMGYKGGFNEYGHLFFSLNTDNIDYFYSFTEEEKSYINLNDACFSIFFDYDLRYIEIAQQCLKKIKLDDVEEVERLKRAVNNANSGFSVVIDYYIDEEEQTMEVNCGTSYPYFPNETYLKDFFDLKITEILLKNWFINRYMEVDHGDGSCDHFICYNRRNRVFMDD